MMSPKRLHLLVLKISFVKEAFVSVLANMACMQLKDFVPFETIDPPTHTHTPLGQIQRVRPMVQNLFFFFFFFFLPKGLHRPKAFYIEVYIPKGHFPDTQV